MLTIYLYPTCSTCKRAKKYLESHQIPFEEKHIVEQPPTREEIKSFVQRSGLPLQNFFNTSGRMYRELQLKDRLPQLEDDEKLGLLVSDGMLLKRPIVTDGKRVTVGFREENFAQNWLNQE